MLILQIQDIQTILKKLGFATILERLIQNMEEDYSNWEQFDKKARVASHVPDGVIELMPTCNDELYSFKYVNGHPKNPLQSKPTVMATGQLSQINTGEPLLFSEMTLLTALRTAAASALAAKNLASKESKVLSLIGTGSQSEFQSLAFMHLFPIEEIRFYDIDEKAMQKYANNMQAHHVKLTACKDAKEACLNSDIITTCTADKRNATVLTEKMITKPCYINALGGDCPGKTELEKVLVQDNHVVVEYMEQSKIEGEIQQLNTYDNCTELYQIIRQEKSLNVATNGTIVYDSVGFALEDFSTLRLFYTLACEHKLGSHHDLIPRLKDVKNLFQLVGE